MTAKQVKEFFDALKLISAEKGIKLNVLIEKLKSAIVLAIKKQYFGVNKINVVIDVDSNEFKVSFFKMVVENVKNFANEISLNEALSISKKARLGEMLEVLVESKQIGRLAAGAAKQQIMQGIRDIEKESLVQRMGERVGTLVAVPVEMVDSNKGDVILKIDGSEVVLFKNSQLPADDFKVDDIVKVYAVNLNSSGSGCLLKVSRTHPDFVRKLFEVEVPEIETGKIEIKRIAREAGVRTKIAVSTNDPNLEPVGCCIGNKGIRIDAVVKELRGEKIDVVKYSENEEEFVSFALMPAKALAVKILVDGSSNEKIAFVAVDKAQISLAIGGKGLNVKLAAILTGCKIDIVAVDEAVDDVQAAIDAALKERVAALKVNEQESPFEEDIAVEKSEQELLEEEDVHNFEVERMLEAFRSAKKQKKAF